MAIFESDGGRQQPVSDRRDVAAVGAAAAADDGEFGQVAGERAVALRELVDVADVEFGRFVEFGVAAFGRIGAHAAQPLLPVTAVEQMGEVAGGM